MSIAALLRTTWTFDWLRLKRAPQFRGKLTLRVLAMLAVGYLLLTLTALGYFIDVAVSKEFPDDNVVTLANRQIIYLFVLLMLPRFFFEKLPHVDFRYFLCLPVAKRKLILTFLIRLAGGKLNVLPLCVAVPFWIKNIVPVYDKAGEIFWLFGFVMLNFVFTLLGMLLKFLFFEVKWGAIVIAATAALLIGFDAVGNAAILKDLSAFVFDSLLQAVLLVLVGCVGLLSLVAVLSYEVLKSRLYVDLR